MKSICILFFVLPLAIAHSTVNCAGECSHTGEVIWATGGGCSDFHNKCPFDKENCHALRMDSNEQCQMSCPNICTLNKQPVSGNYKGHTRNFGGTCEMNTRSCRTGESNDAENFETEVWAMGADCRIFPNKCRFPFLGYYIRPKM